MHRKAVLTLLVCCVLWSLSGIVSRQLEYAASFEAALWRSLFAGLAVAAWLLASRGRAVLGDFRAMGLSGLGSSVMWAIMFTAFMVALLMTTVAKAMVVLAISPLLTALMTWLLLGERIALRTWSAILVAGVGIFYMVSDALQGDANYPYSAWGVAVAALVPLASAFNLIIMKRAQARIDLMPALLVGAVLSVLITLPFAFPFEASPSDVAWLAFLGLFQIALPGILFIRAARHLSPEETALLILLEVVFAPLWVWLGAGERPADATLWGGGLVLAALVANEWLAMRGRRRVLAPAG